MLQKLPLTRDMNSPACFVFDEHCNRRKGSEEEATLNPFKVSEMKGESAEGD